MSDIRNEINALETQFSADNNLVKDEMAQDTHPDKVYEWRKDEFLKLGRKFNFGLATAEWLAKTRVELRRFERVLEQGCPPSVAIDIFEGTCFAGIDERPISVAVETTSDDTE